ncbi:MAG: hypothetical protein Q9227_008795 [Pyrenula ochraceoflavens]
MAPGDDLRAHANSTVDFYELMSISPTASEAEIRQGYRKTTLKYHPDRVGDTPENRENFHQLKIAQDVLSDPTLRALYDQSREARERKKREEALWDSAKRRMVEDLERRERGAKRGPSQDNSADEQERKTQRIAENNRRLMAQWKEKRERQKQHDALKDQERRDQEAQQAAQAREKPTNGHGNSHEPENERTVKVRWIREGLGNDIDEQRLADLFGVFGKVEDVFVLKDKKRRLEGQKEKKIVATGVMTFASVVGARTAVKDASRQEGPVWAAIDLVSWMENKAPDLACSSSSPPGRANVCAKPPPSGSASTKAQFPDGLSGLQSFEESTLKRLINKQREIDRQKSVKMDNISDP